ncbi:permease [Litoreibacter roseus]|uniref:Membrane protein n=1 Tax=Litoreibacter roseus TaxID=2601869 RepID=A0A6N6JCX4_9RHOB|nr:permease [Litoreibacter roseus]GFE63052.1 membrane protein [Litoreibacter roseus]
MADLTQSPRRHWRIWLNSLKSPWTVVVAVPVLVAIFDPDMVGTVVDFSIRAFLNTLPFIVFAVVTIAYLKAAGAEAMIAEAFKGRETRMIFLAALLGGLAPFCSCEVIPFIAGLLALGAPLSAVMAFWLSSPLIDPPTLLITAAALGWPFALAKAISAVALGLFGGFAVKFVASRGFITDPLRSYTTSVCGCGPSPVSGRPVWTMWTDAPRREIFRTSFRENALFLIKWLALAYTLEALLVHYVPADLIAGVVGGEGIGPIVTAALVGMPAYLNGYVAPPLLAGFIEQGMSDGAAMSFMIAGSVSSIPAMAAVWSLVKKGVFALYLSLGVSGAVLSGIVFQMILQ